MVKEGLCSANHWNKIKPWNLAGRICGLFYPEAFWVFQQKRAFSGSFSFREIIEENLEFHLREYI